MFQGFERGEAGMEASEKCRGGNRSGALHRPSGNPHEESTRLFGEDPLGAHESPRQGTGLTGDQQALENGRDGFLLPSFQLLASLLEQLEVGFDPPTPVVPEGNLDIGNRAGQVAQQEPVGQRFPVRGTVRLTINKCTVRGIPGIGGTRCPCSLSRLGLAGRTMVTSALASHCTVGFP